MASIVVKIVKKGDADQIDEAKGVLEGAGFTVEYESSAESLGVDASALNGDKDKYSDATIIVGRKD
jgi:hypothetical protein